MTELERELQRIFEFVVKHHGHSIPWPNREIRKFIRWAWFYKRLFIVWAPAKKDSKRIAAIGVTWRSRWAYPDHDLEVAEKLEDGDFLYAFRVIVHPEFRNRGVLFQLLSMALYRYPGVKYVFWEGHNRGETKISVTSIDHLLKILHKQVKLKEQKKWEKEAPLASLTFAPSH